MDKYIIPPKLNRKLLLFGFTVWEAFAVIGLIILAIFTKVMAFATVGAFIAVLCFRAPESTTGDYHMNALQYILLLIRYYSVSQIYSIRECEP